MTPKDRRNVFSPRAVESYRQGLRECVKSDRREYWGYKRQIQQDYTEDTHVELWAVVTGMLLDNEWRLRDAANKHPKAAELWNSVDLAGELVGLKEAVTEFVGDLGSSETGRYADPDADRPDVELLLAVGDALDDAVVIIADLPSTPPVMEVSND